MVEQKIFVWVELFVFCGGLSPVPTSGYAPSPSKRENYFLLQLFPYIYFFQQRYHGWSPLLDSSMGKGKGVRGREVITLSTV